MCAIGMISAFALADRPWLPIAEEPSATSLLCGDYSVCFVRAPS
jgi:hypothetical protein